ncbi:MAG TPA: PEP-CTERM sorting domain-containing protein [Chthoniobacterales bacterium]|jgi:hypothetical protein
MKKLLILLAALSCSIAGLTTTSAQTATFVYNNGVNFGTYTPGSSFTFSIDLVFTPGGTITNLEGFSYWFQQNNASPYYFSITNRDITGSLFTDLQTPGLSYPQNLSPINANDLGALLPVSTPAEGAGTYLVANLTIAIDPSTPIGVYTIQDVVSGGKTSFIFNSSGTGFRIPASAFTITVVPEPTSIALVVIGSLGVIALIVRNRRRRA